MSLRVFIFCFLFVLTAFYGEEDKEIKVLFTGNTHGYSERFTDKDGTLKGGAAARKTVIDSVTGDLKRTDILLLDAGGFVNGTPQSIFTNGKAEISALNQLGYDAVGVGFTEIMDSFKDFSAYNKESRFYFISSNIQAKKKGIAESYYVKTINGVKVAVVSFVREELITAMSSVAQKDFNIDDPYNTAMELVTAIKNKENPSVIIALTSMGYNEKDSISGVVRLAASVPDIDIIIEADSCLTGNETFTKGKTHIVTTGEKGVFLGELKIFLQNNTVSSVHPKYHLIDESVEEDSSIKNKLASITKNYAKSLEKRVATLKNGTLSSAGRMEKLTTLTSVVTDAVVSETAVDICFINAGFFADAELYEGKIINYDTFNEAIKFDNAVVLLNITGKELSEIFEYSFNRIGYGNFLLYSGAQVDYNAESKVVEAIRIKDQNIADAKIYKVAITDYLANGGDGYELFKKNSTKINTHIPVSILLGRYLTTLKSINAIAPNGLIIK